MTPLPDPASPENFVCVIDDALVKSPTPHTAWTAANDAGHCSEHADHHHHHHQQHDHHHDHHEHHHHGHNHSTEHTVPHRRTVAAIPAPSLSKLARLAFQHDQTLTLWTLLQLSVSLGVWLHGHHAESLALTAYAYLLFFDAFSLLGRLLSRTIRQCDYYTSQTSWQPFGLRRVEVLYTFSNVIFLIFMAIYVVKEGMEHVILTHHDQHNHADFSLSLLVLASSLAVSAVTALVFRHHDALDRLVGKAPRRLAGRDHPLYQLVDCPFSFASLTCCAVALASRFFVAIGVYPSLLDQLACAAVAYIMIYSAYPAFFALAKLLMQSSSAISGLDALLYQLISQPGIVGFMDEHFWNDTFGQVVGTLTVVTESTADTQAALATCHRVLGSGVQQLTVQLVRQPAA